MADILDKAILIGMGLEKKAKEVLDDLQQAGKAASEAKAGGAEPLSAKETVENKVVEDGVKALKEFLTLVKSAREKIEKEVASSSGKVMEKLNVATLEDLEIVKEMARVAREKVDNLEKRVAELEESIGAK